MGLSHIVGERDLTKYKPYYPHNMPDYCIRHANYIQDHDKRREDKKGAAVHIHLIELNYQYIIVAITSHLGTNLCNVA